MEENCVNDKESKLRQEICQLNETVQQLRISLDEKDVLIKSLQKEIRELKKEAVDETKMLKSEENKSVDSQSLDFYFIDDINGSQNKKMKEESAQVNQSPNSADDSEMAVAKALRNPLLLIKIMRNIGTRNLLHNCRLVNREWRDLSTGILLKRKNIQVMLTRHDLKFVLMKELRKHCWKKHAPEKYLEQLTTLLNTSKQFPCANFGFHGNLKTEEAQTFLSKFGSNIKGLQLQGRQKMKMLRKLFGEQVPNLVHLELLDFTVEGKIFFENTPAPKLLSLISFETSRRTNSSLIKEIVGAAPNLQQCKGNWSLEEIQFLLPRLHILKHLILPYGSSDLKSLEKLAKMNIQPKYFEMDYSVYLLEDAEEEESEDEAEYFFESKACKKILAKLDRINSKILSLNRLTLKEIKITPFADCDNLIEWPEMVNVRKLTLSGNENCQLKLPTFKISEKFPQLQTLCITETWASGDLFTEDFVESCDLFMDVAPTVKVLEIDGYFVTFFPHLSKTFPNIQKLSLGEVEDFQSIAATIWNMDKLKSLKLTFFRCTTSEIDVGFTGMEKDTCRFLRYSGRGKMELSEVEKFRVNPSILNLKDLEALHLPEGFQGEPDENDKDDESKTESNVVSFVSFKYAFNLMPQLCVFS